MHNRHIEHYIPTLDDLFVFKVPELASDLAIWSVAKENAFLGSRFKFATVIFQDEGIRLAFENPQFVVIQLTAGP